MEKKFKYKEKSFCFKTVLSNKEKYPDVSFLIKLKDCNIGFNDNTLSLPYYFAF